MIEGAAELYRRSLDKLGPFVKGQFVPSYREGELEIEAVVVAHTDPTLPTVLQAQVRIRFYPVRKTPVEYTLDPTNFSTIARRELKDQGKNPGFLDKLFHRTPRTTVNASEFNLLDTLVRYSTETDEFQAQLWEHSQRLTEEEAQRARKADEAKRRRQRQIEEENARNREKWRLLDAEKSALSVLEKARQIEGERCLGLIVDDSTSKVDNLIEVYEKVKDKLGYKMVFEWIGFDVEAVRLIAAFQKLNAGENQIPLVVFMDGHFPHDSNYPAGINATAAIKAKTEELGLPMPYLVGNGSMPSDNTRLQTNYPDIYLATTRRDYPNDYINQDFDREAWELEPWKAIENAFKMNVELKSRNTASSYI